MGIEVLEEAEVIPEEVLVHNKQMVAIIKVAVEDRIIPGPIHLIHQVQGQGMVK